MVRKNTSIYTDFQRAIARSSEAETLVPLNKEDFKKLWYLTSF
jgi:hypothetical protein